MPIGQVGDTGQQTAIDDSRRQQPWRAPDDTDPLNLITYPGSLDDPADLRLVHTLHVNGSGPEPRLGLFFEARRWIGRPTNREPDKCSAVQWFPLAALPDQLIDYPATGIHAYLDRVPFSIRGWTNQAVPTGTPAWTLGDCGCARRLDVRLRERRQLAG